MGRARQCDRCGKLYTNKELPDVKLTKVVKTASKYSKGIDLCPDCSKELLEWFKGKQNG